MKERGPPIIVDPRRPNQTSEFREHRRQIVENEALALPNDPVGCFDAADCPLAPRNPTVKPSQLVGDFRRPVRQALWSGSAGFGSSI